MSDNPSNSKGNNNKELDDLLNSKCQIKNSFGRKSK